MGRGTYRLAAGLAALLVLVGCASLRKEPPPCSPISVLPDTGNLTIFQPGQGRDATDVAYQGEIAGMRVRCDLADGGKVKTNVMVMLVMRRGPAVDPVLPLGVEMPYFISIIDRNGTVRDKAILRAPVDFARGAPLAGVREDLDVTLELRGDETAADLGVVIGFQLSPEQLQYNRGGR